MMDSFTGLPGMFDSYRNIYTVGEEYPDVPFNKPAASTVSIAAILAASQSFSGSPQNG